MVLKRHEEHVEIFFDEDHTGSCPNYSQHGHPHVAFRQIISTLAQQAMRLEATKRMIAKNVCQDAVGRASSAARQAEILILSKMTDLTWNHSFRMEFWRSFVLTKDNISDITRLAIMRRNIDPQFPHHCESADIRNRPLWSEGHYNQGVLDFGDCQGTG